MPTNLPSPTAADGPFDLDAAVAEMRAFNDRIEQVLSAQPSVHTLPPDKVRAARREGKGIYPPPVFLPAARDLAIPGRSGDIRLRVVTPSEVAPKGVYLHLHGGGWTLGAADLQDPALADVAEETGLVAVSVDYRLAPEHPYPAGPDDCEDAARWLIERGAAALGAPACFAIGGESAGAHLAVVTLLRLRDRHGISGAFRAANLVYGCFDVSQTPSARLWSDRNLILTKPIMRYFAECFLPGMPPEARRAPDVSPLFADLQGMPAALFSAGTLDPLLDDTLFMEARWRAAGIRTELRLYPEAIHAFNMFPTAMGNAANAAQRAFLRELTDG